MSCNVDFTKEPLYCVYKSYADAILAAGGIPLILPIIRDNKEISILLKKFDGFLISGGGNIYNKKPKLVSLKASNPLRYRFEKKIINYALKKDKPLLGICRGCQMLGEVSGGKMFLNLRKDVEGSLNHRQRTCGSNVSHYIKINKDSKLYNVLRTERNKVNSFHRQALKGVSKGFIVSAVSYDNVIEAIESRKHRFILGLQFHPEKLCERYPVFLRIFKEFVNQAKH